MATRKASSNVLIVDRNPDVRMHLAELVRSLGSTPLLPTEIERNGKPAKISTQELSKFLRKTDLLAVIMNGELGLSSGLKRGKDGQRILGEIRDGKYGKRNQYVPVFSIFGDYDMHEYKSGPSTIELIVAYRVINNLTFDAAKSGIRGALAYARQEAQKL